jgi:hypothetical protein
MRRLLTICLLALAAALVAAPATPAASGPAPTITRVKPMRVSVGNLLTITGTRFKAQRNRNTVIFRGPDGRTAFAKPRRATTRKLVVRVPAAVARLLRVSGSRQRPTRLKLRVLSGQFSKFTPRRLSPVVTGVGDGDGGPGGGGDGGGGGTTVVCNNTADHDGDLLPNTLELAIGTDPCLADTDNDQMTDGWEYWSAKDLNIKAVPYPGERPFTNALDPSDGAAAPARYSNVDFDGDGLTSVEEYRAWRYTGSSFDAAKAGTPDLESPLGYSDGTKYSRATEVPGVPSWRGPAYGLAAPAQAFPATMNLHGDGAWRDDERDADGDGMANFIESVHGPGQPAWWAAFYNQEGMKAEVWPKPATPCGQEFGAFTARPFAELDMADPDVDGDSLLDGEDDQDNDDFTNIQEMYEPMVPGMDLDGDGGFTCSGITYPSIDLDPGAGVDPHAVNAFNPCAPNPSSRTCVDWKPFE